MSAYLVFCVLTAYFSFFSSFSTWKYQIFDQFEKLLLQFYYNQNPYRIFVFSKKVGNLD